MKGKRTYNKRRKMGKRVKIYAKLNNKGKLMTEYCTGLETKEK